MRTPGYKDQVLGRVLDIAWSLWAELGVSGWSRRHRATAVDLESLMVFTATLGQRDARLRDETLAWCVANSRFVSAIRLRHLLRATSPPGQAAFGDYSATAKQQIRVSWPGDGSAWPFARTGRSSRPDLGRSALLQLRLRAVV